MNFWHKLFNPHCIHCHDELTESKICDNCEYLKQQLSILQQERNLLLGQILDKPEPIQHNELVEQPINLNTSRFVPFAVKRQELEARDRQIARNQAEDLKNNHNRNIETLEKEILEAKVDPVELNGAMNAE